MCRSFGNVLTILGMLKLYIINSEDGVSLHHAPLLVDNALHPILLWQDVMSVPCVAPFPAICEFMYCVARVFERNRISSVFECDWLDHVTKKQPG